jgi:hypothetical protein
MFRTFSLLAVAIVVSSLHLRAVEMNGAYDTVEPTDADIPNWDSGWGATGITGWDYLGSVNGASGVYLGNGWVLTAGHVGAGNFVITNGPDANTYTYTGVSHSISNADGTADLTLFQIANAPSLPTLSLITSTPSTFLYNGSGAGNVAMLGYGGSGTNPLTHLPNETWGYNTVTLANEQIMVDGYPYNSDDFITSDTGESVSNGLASHTNNSQLVSGDSGGGDFIYNSSLGEWQLGGINEAIGSGTIGKYHGTWYLANDASDFPTGSTSIQNIDFSAMVQMSSYYSQIDAIVDAPEPRTWTLLLASLAGMVLGHRVLARRQHVVRLG